LLRRSVLNAIILPRQARDKHGEITHTKEGDHFLAGGRAIQELEAGFEAFETYFKSSGEWLVTRMMLI
jgi:hypothetical protein